MSLPAKKQNSDRQKRGRASTRLTACDPRGNLQDWRSQSEGCAALAEAGAGDTLQKTEGSRA